VLDPSNAELRTLEAYALLGIATVLSKRGAAQDALSKQTEASNTLRALFDADAKDTEARYNAAFALSEVSATLAALGQFQAAELKLRDALAIIEPLAVTDDPGMGHAKALQVTATERLQKITARVK
jgi:tetratricopeptide (TPR) repeat protein